MARSFKVQMNIIKKPYDRPVHYKMDGARFGESDKTVKFNVNSKYVIDFNFRPPVSLEQISILGNKLAMDEIQRTEESVVYRGELLTTGLTKCVKGTRKKMHIQMQIRNVGELKSQLQCKFYGEHEMQHTCWGTPLGYIEYEFQANESSSFVELIKETYR